MISKAAILERAAEWQLDPEVVEKDYVLGWLLWGIARHSVLGEHWVFKGGTCLKKCVIETYRFSEDLDFSLLPSAPYTAGEIRPLLLELVADVEASSGIAFPRDAVTVKPRQDRVGRRTFEGRTGHVGPIGNHGPPRIRFDLTIHETVVRSPIRRTVIHPYPDPFPEERGVLSYSTAELIAEKTRALVERTRPRDLYDVILLGTVHRDVSLEEALRGVAREKFATKGLSLPSAEEIIRMARASEELRSEWINMLGHQLPAVPELDDYLERLTDALSWIEEPATGTTHRAPGLASIATSDEVPVIERWRAPMGCRRAPRSHSLRRGEPTACRDHIQGAASSDRTLLAASAANGQSLPLWVRAHEGRLPSRRNPRLQCRGDRRRARTQSGFHPTVRDRAQRTERRLARVDYLRPAFALDQRARSARHAESRSFAPCTTTSVAGASLLCSTSINAA